VTQNAATRPVALEMNRTLPGPPEVVWPLITDWENQGDWMLEAGDFVVISPQREGVGVVAEATVSIAGIKTRDRVRVVAWVPPEHLAIAHEGWVSGRGDLRLTRTGDRATTIVWREELYPPLGMLGRHGIMALKPVMQRIFERDLRILESLTRVAARTP
jgi:hypothetical protein